MEQQRQPTPKFLDKNYTPKQPVLDLRKFVNEWNRLYPWDLWWRKKYKIPFGSQQHRSMSHIDMLFEYEEVKLMEKLREREEAKKEAEENDTLGLETEIQKKEIKMSRKEQDKAFEDLNLDEFN